MAGSGHHKKESHSNLQRQEINVFCRDDGPVIRPLTRQAVFDPSLLRPKRRRPKYFDGYGGEGCERITKLSNRSFAQWIGSAIAITLGGAMVFGLLVKTRGVKKEVRSP